MTVSNGNRITRFGNDTFNAGVRNHGICLVGYNCTKTAFGQIYIEKWQPVVRIHSERDADNRSRFAVFNIGFLEKLVMEFEKVFDNRSSVNFLSLAPLCISDL